MRLAPGLPLAIGLLSDESTIPVSVGRLAMAEGIAQLEWSPEALAAGLPIAPLLYELEPGLQAARTRSYEGLHGFLSDSLPDAWGTLLMRRRLAKIGQSLAQSVPSIAWLWLADKAGVRWSNGRVRQSRYETEGLTRYTVDFLADGIGNLAKASDRSGDE